MRNLTQVTVIKGGERAVFEFEGKKWSVPNPTGGSFDVGGVLEDGDSLWVKRVGEQVRVDDAPDRGDESNGSGSDDDPRTFWVVAEEISKQRAAVGRLIDATRNESVQDSIGIAVEFLWHTVNESAPCADANDLIYAVLKEYDGMTREQMEEQVASFLLYLKCGK